MKERSTAVRSAAHRPHAVDRGRAASPARAPDRRASHRPVRLRPDNPAAVGVADSPTARGATVKLHLDTDFGGDPDDACALAMLLGWPGAELVGITKVLDVEGLRAAYVAHALGLVHRADIPLAAGAPVSLTTGLRADPVVGDERHWPRGLAPRPSPPEAALALLARNIDAGAVVAAIGPLTNLALLEAAWPGALRRARVVAMGGWVLPPHPGLPNWGPEMDFNVQWDAAAAEAVFDAAGHLILTTLPATLTAHLRATDLPRLRASGPLGTLLADQSGVHAEEYGMTVLGRNHADLPNDLLNVHYDPAACAVAVGWPGATVEEMRLRTLTVDGVLQFRPDAHGRPVGVVVAVDGDDFAGTWLAAVEASQRPEARPP